MDELCTLSTNVVDGMDGMDEGGGISIEKWIRNAPVIKQQIRKTFPPRLANE